MSILIKGMEMPIDCRDCPLQIYYMANGQTKCRVTGKILADFRKPIPFEGRAEECPIIEVPSADMVNDAHNEGFDVGYWAGRRDYEPKWIPVTEQLPEPDDKVLTFARFLADGSWWMDITSWTGVTNHDVPKFWGYGDEMVVTHWMPLPEPPKDGE